MEFLVKELHKEWDRSGASKASVIISREDRTDPYNTLEMTNLRIQADMEAQKQVMEEIIHPRIG